VNPYKFLNIFNKFGSEGGFKPGLERIKKLLSEFKNPENKLNIVHVAGTNGKGSTINFMKNIYVEAGYRVGVYTSPSLLRFNERIMINNKQITDAELKKRICKNRLNELNQVLFEKNIIDDLKKVELTRNKYYAHLDRKRPSFEEIRISSEQIRSFLGVAEYYIKTIRYWFGMPDASFENTKSELGRKPSA